MKLAILALLVLPALASADDTVPNVGDLHVGVADFALGGDASAVSGGGFFADAEAGWRLGSFDLTGFGAYATRLVVGSYDDGFGAIDKRDYRMHVIDLGARATLRGRYAYGGIGLAFENEIDSGTSQPPSGAMQQINESDQHVAGELRLGAIIQHVDISGSVTVASAFGDSLATFRLGVGYRF